MGTKPPHDPRIAYIKGIVRIDKLLQEAAQEPLFLALPRERRDEMINNLLENRSEMMTKRDCPFRVVDNRRIK